LKPPKKLSTAQKQVVNDRIGAEIDQILASEEELIPTSGFLSSVMERVEEEAAVPPPLPFPWRRLAPGIALAAGVICWGAVELVRGGMPSLTSFPQLAPHLSETLAHSAESAGWVALALGVSLISWSISRRLAGRGGLL